MVLLLLFHLFIVVAGVKLKILKANHNDRPLFLGSFSLLLLV